MSREDKKGELNVQLNMFGYYYSHIQITLRIEVG
jgi:hypothetical protein